MFDELPDTIVTSGLSLPFSKILALPITPGSSASLLNMLSSSFTPPKTVLLASLISKIDFLLQVTSKIDFFAAIVFCLFQPSSFSVFELPAKMLEVQKMLLYPAPPLNMFFPCDQKMLFDVPAWTLSCLMPEGTTSCTCSPSSALSAKSFSSSLFALSA